MFQTDPISSTLVAFSATRSKRPHRPKTCPFCPGSEHLTPPATLVLPFPASGGGMHQVSRRLLASGKATRTTLELPVLAQSSGKRPGKRLPLASSKLTSSKASGWSVRCFPNAFPIVWGKNGRHEVIVETPEHGLVFEDFTLDQLGHVFEAYQRRFCALSQGKTTHYVLLMKNFGDKSGASIPHEHSQVLSLPFVPHVIQNELNRTVAFERIYRRADVLAENKYFKALVPTVPRFPYETWIVAKDDSGGPKNKGKRAQTNAAVRFEDFSQEQGLALLSLMQTVIRKIKKVQGAPDYNFAFHAAPPGLRMRFHVEIYPRKGLWGGIELGAGVLVNHKSSALALKELKKA